MISTATAIGSVPRPSRAARPRDAATLIIVDRSTPQIRLLMGRRSAGHGFMPNKWVFPGGRIERGDFNLPCASELVQEVSTALEEGLAKPRARALAATAIRETFEETGLLLGVKSQQSCDRPAWRGFFAHGLAPDLDGLAYIARLITPPLRPKRFDTRFFLVDADRLHSRAPMDSRELEEVDWLSMEQALALDLALPTRMMLGDLAQRLTQPERPVLFRRFRSPGG